jgi:hypothetical protein
VVASPVLGGARVRGRVSKRKLGSVRASGTESHKWILCPLGQPEKVIGYKSQIESWLPSRNRFTCPASGIDWHRRHNRKMNLDENHIAGDQAETRSQNYVGLDARANPRPSSGRRGNISLDIPFYRISFSHTTQEEVRAVCDESEFWLSVCGTEPCVRLPNHWRTPGQPDCFVRFGTSSQWPRMASFE